MLSELVNDFQPLAAEHNRAIDVVAAPGCRVESDPRYSKQVLHALLTNALIHGRGDIQIRLARRGECARCIIFNLVRASPTRSELTLGLGLRVVKVLVSQQPSLTFGQRHTSRYHATLLSFPILNPAERTNVETPVGKGASA
jgi:hypothetical protein